MFAATPSATIGIEALPACEGHCAHASDDADGGPDVGEQVLGIGFKSNGVALAPHPQQQQGHDEVHQRGQHRNRQAQADLFERFGSDEAANCRVSDAHGGQQNERALDAAGEVLGLAVAVGVVLIRGPGGDGQHGQGHDAADEVDERLNGVGEQAHRPGQAVGNELSSRW